MSCLSLHNVCCLGKARTDVSKLMAKYWLLGWGWKYKELLGEVLRYAAVARWV